MSAALIVVALVAILALALVLVLARRVKAVTERVNMFLPVSEGQLPSPGTPLPEFTAAAVDGTTVAHTDLAAGERIVALLTTDCGSCHDQIGALQNLRHEHRPFVVVIGGDDKRAEMVTALAPHATVVEERDHGHLAKAFDVHEFPAVLVFNDGYVRTAAHGVATALTPV